MKKLDKFQDSPELSEKISNKEKSSTPMDDLMEEEESSKKPDEDSIKLRKKYSQRRTDLTRSTRGLRTLSFRVRELVFEKQETTYKEVSDELIKELQNGLNMTNSAQIVNFIRIIEKG